MADLKNTWKEAGKGIGFAFRDLGKAVISTAKIGVDKVDEWANGNDTEKSTGAVPETEKKDEE